MTVILTRADFVEWLDENRWFNHASVHELTASSSPADAPTPQRVRLVFRVQTAGSITAGEGRSMRELTIDASAIRRYEFDEWNGGFSSDHCCEEADLVESSSAPIAFALQIPARLVLECDRLDVAARDWEELVPASHSERECYATIRNEVLPSPEDWVTGLAEQGLQVCWRYFDGPSTAPVDVPADYEGWFVQYSARVAETTQGVMFFTAQQHGADCRLAIVNAAQDDGALWRACGLLIGSFADVSVQCGNAILDGRSWVAHLRGDRLHASELGGERA